MSKISALALIIVVVFSTLAIFPLHANVELKQGEPNELCMCACVGPMGAAGEVGFSESSLLTPSSASSVPPPTEWNRTYGGIYSDKAYSVQQTSDGGYIVAGSTASTSDDENFLVVKTNATGDWEWGETYGGYDDDVAYSVQQNSYGGYIVAGSTASLGAGEDDFWLVETLSDGTMLQNRAYGTMWWEYARSVQQTTDGGYIVAGYGDLYVGGGFSFDFWLVKTNDDLTMSWNKTYDGAGYDEAYSVQQTTDGGYIVAGRTVPQSGGDSDIWLVKTDMSGNMKWSQEYGGSNAEGAYSVQQTTDGGYIIAGYKESFTSDYDFWLVKTWSNGTIYWDRTYDGAGHDDDTAYSVQQTSDGGYIVAGETWSYDADLDDYDSDFWLVRTDESGDIQWDKTYGGEGFDYARSVQQTTEGGYIIAGYTESFGAGPADFWLIKLGPPVHDVAITDVDPSTAEAHAGEIVNISVIARNEGTETESFEVSVYYNAFLIETLPVNNLPPNTEANLTSSWNTIGIAPGNYLISAVASTVPDETDTEDNTYTDGTVKITISYTLTIAATAGGTTDPLPGTYTHVAGTEVSVGAIADANYIFDHWELDCIDVGSANPYRVIMDSDHTLTANFTEMPPTQYDLTIRVVGSGTTDPAPGIYTYDEGTMVNVAAIPHSGWTFDHWELDGVFFSFANPTSVTMDADHTLHAVFLLHTRARARLYTDPRKIPGPGQIGHPGEEYNMSVIVDRITDLWSVEFEIRIAPYTSVLVPSDIEEGDFLSEGGTWPTYFYSSIDAPNGIIYVSIRRLPIPGMPMTGVSGSGTLITFNLTVIEAGESPIDIANDFLRNSSEDPIPHNTYNGYYYGATADLIRVEVLPARVVKAGETLFFWSRVRSESDIPLWVRVRFDIERVEDGRRIVLYAGQTYLGGGLGEPLPFTYLYVDEYNLWQESGWDNSGASIFGEPDDSYAESSTDEAMTSAYSFEDLSLQGREIADITFEGYTQYPNGPNEDMDIDIYGFSNVQDWAWLGSLYGDTSWDWHGVRWTSLSVLDVMPELENEAELNGLQILLHNYDPTSTGELMRVDSLRLKVEFATIVPTTPPIFEVSPFEVEELDPVTWISNPDHIGRYQATATIEYTSEFVSWNSWGSRPKTFWFEIVDP